MKIVLIMFITVISMKAQPQSRILSNKVLASFYHDMFVGRTCASGEIFNQKDLTAAHRTLKFGTLVKVINLKNDSSVIVRINDRMPPHGKCEIDLTKTAAQRLNFIHAGIAEVRLEIFEEDVAVTP
jgi:rare lipoprotein A